MKVQLGILLLTSFVPHNMYGTHQIKWPNEKSVTTYADV